MVSRDSMYHGHQLVLGHSTNKRHPHGSSPLCWVFYQEPWWCLWVMLIDTQCHVGVYGKSWHWWFPQNAAAAATTVRGFSTPAVEEKGFSSFLGLSRTLFFLPYCLETSSCCKEPWQWVTCLTSLFWLKKRKPEPRGEMSPKVTYQEPATDLAFGFLYLGRVLGWVCPFHRWETRWGEPLSLSLLSSWSSSKEAPNIFCVMYTAVAVGVGLLPKSPAWSWLTLPHLSLLYHLIFQREKLRIASKCIKRGGAVDVRPRVVIPPLCCNFHGQRPSCGLLGAGEV